MRKKLLRSLLLAAILCVLLSATAYAETATITGDEVNLRSGPGINYEVLGCFPEGTVVTVHDRSNSQWYSITVEGARGFMSSAYLSLDGGEQAQEPEETVVVTGNETAEESGSINAMYVRFRSAPSLEASVLGEYNRGTSLTITGTEGDWTAVIINGTRGYIFSTYVTRGSVPATQPEPQTQEPAPTPEPAPEPTAAPVVSDGTNAVLVKEDVYLYCEPTFYSDIKGAFDKGDRLTINGETGDWYIVNIQGFPGYIYKENVRKDEVPAPTPTPEATPASTSAPAAAEPRSGYVNADHVHLRSEPSTSSAIKGVYNKNDHLTITGESGDWFAVTIEGTSGYMFKTYVTADAVETTPEPTPAATEAPAETPAPPSDNGEDGYVTGNNVRLRSQPSTAGEILGEYNSGTALRIVGASGEWTEVVIGSARGYMYSGYVAKGKVTVISDSTDSTEEGYRMAQFALQYVGYPYVWAGKSPETGFDCSGLAYYTYTSFGYSMYRVADDQTRNGVHVDPSDLQPGDLLCFYSGGSYVGHVGIYIGNGKFVHASTYTTGVIVSELDGYYVNRGFEARRIAGTNKDGPGE